MGVIGAGGALLQLAGYSFAFLISSALEHDPYYNPFDFQALFLLAGLVIATMLGLAGGVISRKSSRAGGRVLFAATGVGFLSYIPYYFYTFQGLSIIALLLYFPPWWTMLLLAGGLFAFQTKTTTTSNGRRVESEVRPPV